jgi:hypothetical protein
MGAFAELGATNSGNSGTDTTNTTGGDSATNTTEEVEPNYAEELYLFYENYENPNAPIQYNPQVQDTQALITDPAGTMDLYAKAVVGWSMAWANDIGVGTMWSIEHQYDEDGNELPANSIAVIDRADGTVTALAQGNGTIIVRCTATSGVEPGNTLYAEMPVVIKGNSGQPYVTDIQICDENGNVYEDDAEIRIDEADLGLAKKFYVQVTYHDPITGTDTVKNSHDDGTDFEPRLHWTTSGDANVGYVNEETGVFIGQKRGTVRLDCSITGAGQLGDTVNDYVIVLLAGDTLDPSRDYSPSDYLKVVVKYAAEDKSNYGSREDYEDARTWYYTPEQLESLGVTENLYTLVKGDNGWGSMKARGVYLADLISDQDLELSEIEGFYFYATDEYNPGFVGCDWVFQQRYYFPNMSIGSGMAGAIGVAPMIATSTVQQDLVDEPTGDLSIQTRFRLCLGAESTTSNNAQKSIYNIYCITIILEGAPPVGWGEPGNGQSTEPGNGSGGGTDPDGKGDDQGGDSDSGGSDSEGDKKGGGGDEKQDETPDARGDQSSNDEKSEAQDSSSSSATVNDIISSAQPSSDAGATDNGNAFGTDEHRWSIYEMMTTQESDIEALAMDNPLGPWVIVILILVLLGGGASAYLRFKKLYNPLATSPGDRNDHV